MEGAGGGGGVVFTKRRLGGGGVWGDPVAVNLFGSERRMALALGVDRLDEIGERIAELLNLKVPDGLFGKLAMLPRLAEVAKFPPKTIGGRPPGPGDRVPGRGFGPGPPPLAGFVPPAWRAVPTPSRRGHPAP